MPSLDAWFSDRHLFGALPVFRSLDSWRPWLAFQRACYGLPMDEIDVSLFRKHTGHQSPREGGYAEAVVITGRQSGKTQVAALVGVHEAALAVISGQRNVFVPLIAQDLRGTQRALLSYVREAFTSIPMLSKMVKRETAEGIELSHGVQIGVYPCRPAALRGIRSAAAIIDELAFFISTDGRPTDTEMLRAVRPTLATTGGRLLILSSPYGASGALWDLHRKHFGRERSDTLVWQASAPEMNPTLPADYLERMERDDPEAYRSEILGEFRSGIGQLLDPEALDACVACEVREREPASEHAYVSFCDPSGGRRDAFTIAIAHLDRSTHTAVLDCLRAWPAPFNPSGVIGEAAELLKRYRLSQVSGDRYSAEFVTEHFRVQGIRYEPSELDRSGIYLELLPLINSGAALLLDVPELLREFRGLERRRGTSGRDRVDHRPGAHDDRANASAGALVLAAKKHRVEIRDEHFYIGPALDSVAGPWGAGEAEDLVAWG